MQFTYELVGPQELTKTEKILLACRGEDFCCIRHNGVVKINKALPKPKTVAKIAATMWQYDRLMDEPEAWEIDALWKQLRQIAGETGADQIYQAWSEAIREKLDAEDKRAAAEWLQGRDIPGELDAMGLVGRNVADHIKSLYEKEGYKVFAVEPIKPKRIVDLDLCQLWNEAEPPISEEIPATITTEEEDTAE